MFYGDKINKIASQIWGEKAFIPAVGGTGGSQTPDNNGLVSETYYLLSESDAANRVSNYNPDNPTWWYFDTYTNSNGLTYKRYFNDDTRITGAGTQLNNATHDSCGYGALAIAMSPYLSSSVSPYNIMQRIGKWRPEGGWSREGIINEAPNYTGIQSSWGTSDKIASYISQGKTVIVSVDGQTVYDSVLGKNVRYCDNPHYITIIDCKIVDGNTLYYVDNPLGDVNYASWFNKYNAYGEGWVSATALNQVLRYNDIVVIGTN